MSSCLKSLALVFLRAVFIFSLSIFLLSLLVLSRLSYPATTTPAPTPTPTAALSGLWKSLFGQYLFIPEHIKNAYKFIKCRLDFWSLPSYTHTLPGTHTNASRFILCYPLNPALRVSPSNTCRWPRNHPAPGIGAPTRWDRVHYDRLSLTLPAAHSSRLFRLFPRNVSHWPLIDIIKPLPWGLHGSPQLGARALLWFLWFMK